MQSRTSLMTVAVAMAMSFAVLCDGDDVDVKPNDDTHVSDDVGCSSTSYTHPHSDAETRARASYDSSGDPTAGVGVRRVKWSRAALDDAVRLGIPTVLQGVPIDLDPWSPQLLASVLPAVQRFEQATPLFRYFSATATLPSDPALPRRPDEHIVPAKVFFNAEMKRSHATAASPGDGAKDNGGGHGGGGGGGGGGAYVYASGPVEEVGLPLAMRDSLLSAGALFHVSDVGGVDDALLESDGSTTSGPDAGERGSVLTSVWFAGAGATAAMHYDTAFNVHATLWGAKTYTLAPPDSHSVGLFPSLHPHYRQLRPAARDSVMANTNTTVVVQVGPGDAIYVPPFWLHEVKASDPHGAVSVSWWSESQAYWAMEDAFILGV
jgi:hypothetical protein